MGAFEDTLKSNGKLLKLAEIGQGVVDLVRDSGLLKPKKRKRVRADASPDPVSDSNKGSDKAATPKKGRKQNAGLGAVPDLPQAG